MSQVLMASVLFLQNILNSNLYYTVAAFRCERICIMGLTALGEGKPLSRCSPQLWLEHHVSLRGKDCENT